MYIQHITTVHIPSLALILPGHVLTLKQTIIDMQACSLILTTDLHALLELVSNSALPGSGALGEGD
jgi:hypothetical protein